MCDVELDIGIPSVDGTTSSVIAVVSGMVGLIAGGGWPSDSVPSSFNSAGVWAESSIFPTLDREGRPRPLRLAQSPEERRRFANPLREGNSRGYSQIRTLIGEWGAGRKAVPTVNGTAAPAGRERSLSGSEMVDQRATNYLLTGATAANWRRRFAKTGVQDWCLGIAKEHVIPREWSTRRLAPPSAI